jgi:hypothetical protein
MEEKTLISFVNHYSNCPMCSGNIVINTDLSIPSTVDKTEDGILITVYEESAVYLIYSLPRSSPPDAENTIRRLR